MEHILIGQTRVSALVFAWHAERERPMRLRWIVTFVTTVAALFAMGAGLSAPANAQGWHHDHDRAYGGWHRDHGYGGGYGWHRQAYYHHYVQSWGPAYAPGPGYGWHSWGWYESQPLWWRHHHPYYHGGPSIGVWFRL